MSANVDLSRPLPAVALKLTSWISEYFDTRLEGVENIPQGGALLVGNHSLGGLDSIALIPAILEATSRLPRGLALKSLFGVPPLAHMLHQFGLVEGGRDTAVALLKSDELVLVYPGGARDSMKGSRRRYELRWAGRLGFAEVARLAQCPVIPVAAIGPDDVIPILSNHGPRVSWLNGERVPIFLPLARKVPFVFHLGRPIEPPTSPEQVMAFAQQVERSLQTLIVNGLTARQER